jgi:hypothetical protein
MGSRTTGDKIRILVKMVVVSDKIGDRIGFIILDLTRTAG